MSPSPRRPLVIGDAHIHATAEGRVIVRVRGDGPAVVTVRSSRPLTARWLRGGRPRLVRLGEVHVTLPPTGTTTLTFPLSADHLALLHRMQTLRTTISVSTAAGVCRRRVYLHAPPRSAGRPAGEAGLPVVGGRGRAAGPPAARPVSARPEGHA